MRSPGAILLAEDDEDAVVLMRLAYAKSRLANPLQLVNDGAKAIGYLDGEGEFADRAQWPFPSLLLLDLKMPKKNGFEVLAWLRAAPGINRLPVIVLTSSQERIDINRAYDLGANSFVTKPPRFDDLVDLLNRLEGWWIGANQMPGLEEMPSSS